MMPSRRHLEIITSQTQHQVYGLTDQSYPRSLVLMVPDSDAFPKQDPRVVATSLTFSPPSPTSLPIQSDLAHASTAQLSRVLVPCETEECVVQAAVEATVWCVENANQLYLIKWRHRETPTWIKVRVCHRTVQLADHFVRPTADPIKTFPYHLPSTKVSRNRTTKE